MIEPVTFSAIAIYVGDKILEHCIQEEIWVKRILHKIFPQKTFRNELYKTIDQTIDEYKLNHSYEKNETKSPFYDSQILLDALSKHILFAKEQNYSSKGIQDECEKNPNIIRPTQKELYDFYSLFISKIKNNKELSRLYIEENYKERVYEISGMTSTILDILLKAELTSEIVLNKLLEQTQYQIDKQKRSRKYISETFIETNELKDHIRYFVAPFLFIDKVYDEIKNIRFNYLRQKLKLRKKNDKFDFNITAFPLKEIKKSHDNYVSFVNYLKEKHNTLEKMGYNETWATSWKIKQKIEDLEYIASKIIILKDNAGQGKTNLLCDIAENVLIKRNIPSAFFTGYELNADDICNSIIQRLFPDRNYTFNDIFSRIENYCKDNNTFFILLIDGLNENSNPTKFSQQLELFISEIFKYKYVKIILSCRTEYYENNFSNLSNASFKDSLIQVDNINKHLNELHKKRLYETYLSYFQIKINEIAKDVYKQLVDNFLLLRIFSEAHHGQNIPQLSHIYKDELFQEYYKIECKAINQRLSNEGFSSNVNIAKFFKLMIQYMIEHNCYENVPLDEILRKDTQNQSLYFRFLDDNILVRKDLNNQEGISVNCEHVNFTFDEFRDFLIADYLLREVYPNNSNCFENFLNNIDSESRIKEGCISFLFSMERKINNQILSDIIHKQAWYKEVFPYYIFDIQDSYVTKADKLSLKKIFLIDSDITENITLSLAYQRWNEILFPNLNIQLLFEILNNLTDEEFMSNIYPIYQNDNYSYYSENKLDKLIEDLQEILDENDFNSHPSTHNIFLYILYFMPLSDKIESLYKKYWEKYANSKYLKFILQCKSSKIKNRVKIFMRDYEIQL